MTADFGRCCGRNNSGSQAPQFNSSDMGWACDEMVAEPLLGQESKKWGGFQCHQHLQYMCTSK